MIIKSLNRKFKRLKGKVSLTIGQAIRLKFLKV